MKTVEASERRRTFCAQLKQEREGRGRSIADIAEATKVSASLLEALERGDLTRWPKGIYRRSFFRSYVMAIGLEPDSLVNEFLDLCADGDVARVTANPLDAEPVSFRLLYIDQGNSPGRSAVPRPLRVRVAAAAIDVAAVTLLALLASVTIPIAFPIAALALGVTCYAAAAVLAMSPAEWLLTHPRLRRTAGHQPSVEAAPPSKQATAPGAATTVFEPSTLPYNAFAPSTTRTTTALRAATEAVSAYAERISDARSSVLNGQRRRDLATMRRRRVEEANRAPGDELSIR
jgi:ribosome-binding protein aMBF1 (putative translation factor)